MKKRTNIVAIATLMMVSLASCTDVLDKEPKNSYSEDEVWSSPELTQAFIYSSLNKATEYMIMNDQWTDNTMIQDDGNATNINKEQIDRSLNIGWHYYEDIRNCNLILERVPNSAMFTESDRKYFIAQGKMMRALIYFSRARLFGKLMIVDRVLNEKDDMLLSRTATIKDTYDFILKDMKEAASDLPKTLNNAQGMLTQGVAYAYIAEVALHGAAYVESGQDEYYALAKEASENLFDLNEYALDTNYEKLFNDYNHAMVSKEIILARWRHADNTNFSGTWMQSLVINTNNDKNITEAWPRLVDDLMGWPLSFPSADLAKTYQVVDEDGEAKNWDETSYYKNYLTKGGYVSEAIYKNRDKRFYATVVQDSSKYFNSMITTRKKGNAHWESNIYGEWGMSKTGYLYRKGVYEVRRLYYSDPTNYHWVLMRLGRAYLNYAEVMLRTNNPSKALEYVNKTRVEHGGLPALPTALPLAEAWKEYKRERRLELTMEGDRYWSLLRWGKADNKETIEELNLLHQAISIAADGKSFEHIPLYYRAGDNIRVFTKKRYLFPVPQKERDENPNLDQNPGW